MVNVIFDAIKDCLIMFPFLFFIYVFIECIENTKGKAKIEKALSGSGAPIVASALGVVPECGFPVMIAKLYDSGLIQTGTLIAAFISVSDEGLIVLISGGASLSVILRLVLSKVLIAMLIGLVLNALLKRFDNKHHCSTNGECVHCGKRQGGFLDRFVFHPFSHASVVFIFILIEEIIIACIIRFVGVENFATFINKSAILQPLVTSLVGLIPNCASSIIIAEGYLSGVLTFSGLIAGLTSNAGIAMLVLLKSNKSYKTALLVMVILYVLGVLLGYLSHIVW